MRGAQPIGTVKSCQALEVIKWAIVVIRSKPDLLTRPKSYALVSLVQAERKDVTDSGYFILMSLFLAIRYLADIRPVSSR